MKSHAANCRASKPIPEREHLTWPQIQQLHIIKGSLLSWINNHSSTKPPGHKICIVFTSSTPGLVAAQEIIKGQNLPLVYLYPKELSDFLQSIPDNKYRHHVHIWSHFLEELDNDSRRIARRYPIQDAEKYWLHVEGIMQGQQLGRGLEHLWSWDGNHAKLLRKSFMHWAT